MSNEISVNNASKALVDFQKKYPNINSSDLQTFLLGYNSRNEEVEELVNALRKSVACMAIINPIDFQPIQDILTKHSEK